jgi:hypothetical protein
LGRAGKIGHSRCKKWVRGLRAMEWTKPRKGWGIQVLLYPFLSPLAPRSTPHCPRSVDHSCLFPGFGDMFLSSYSQSSSQVPLNTTSPFPLQNWGPSRPAYGGETGQIELSGTGGAASWADMESQSSDTVYPTNTPCLSHISYLADLASVSWLGHVWSIATSPAGEKHWHTQTIRGGCRDNVEAEVKLMVEHMLSVHKASGSIPRNTHMHICTHTYMHHLYLVLDMWGMHAQMNPHSHMHHMHSPHPGSALLWWLTRTLWW